MPNSLDNLPPEMRERIQSIISQGQAFETEQAIPEPPRQAAVSHNAPAQLATRPPSLMDHVIALRQEVQMLSQQVQASSQVTAAVGDAVSQMYNMFQVQTQPSNYSATFQTQKPSLDDEF
jgi:hypothetical protein